MTECDLRRNCTDMARPNWEYIRVDVLLPEHPKLDGLSAAAKWVLVEIWCYCGRQRSDGLITDQRWKTFGTRAYREQILAAGLVEKLPVGGYLVHDFVGEDGHQRSRNQIEEGATARSERAKKAAQARWGTSEPPLIAGGESTP